MTSRVVKSAFWYTASNVLVKALGFITIPIFTRLLTQDDFGIYNNYISWLSVMTFVVSLSLEATLISAKRDFHNDMRNYVFSMMCLSMLSAILWLIAANIFLEWFEAVFLLQAPYVLSIFFYLVFFPLVTLFQTWERFCYRYKVTVAISVALALGTALLSVCMAVALPNRLAGVICGRLLPAVVIGLGILIWFFLEKSVCHFSYWRYAIPIVWPYIPHLLALTLLGAMNKVFITHFCGSDANALYSLAYTCGLMVSVFLTSLNNAFAPWLGDKLTAGNTRIVKQVARPYLLLFCVLAVGMALFAPEAMMILGGEEYLPAEYAIAPITMACVFQFVYCMYVNVEQYEKRTIGMAFASISAALLNALLDILLIPKLGYIAAAYASMISYCWLMIIHMLLVKRIGCSHVYSNFFNVGSSFCTCILIGCIIPLYPFLYCRILIFVGLVIVAAMLIFKRKSNIRELFA